MTPTVSAAGIRGLEAILDARLTTSPADLDPPVRAELEASGLLTPDARERALAVVHEAARGRRAEWAERGVTQADVLAAFARHCREDLEEVEVIDHDGLTLAARWRRETGRIELRSGTVGIERLTVAEPTMLLADLDHAGRPLVEAYLDDAALRGSVAIIDLARLERLGAVRSSLFVFLDWFLRETYGIKVLPANAFTQGLLARGIISLGMG